MTGNQTGRRRPPKPVPGLASIAERAIDSVKSIEEKERNNLKSELGTLFRSLEQYLRVQNQETYLGVPAPHTHDDDDSGGALDGGAELVAWLSWMRSNC